MTITKPMAIAQDEWVTEALTDDDMVVELLLRIKHAENPPLLRWGSRQRRSQPSRLNVGGLLKKERDSARASPMTPLCWSGGSGSGGSTCPSAATVDGFDDSTCSTSTGSGSKAVRVTDDITCSKRSKKQKIFFDLKDAQNLQLKARLDFQEKIANVQTINEKRSAKNQSFKRIKLEYTDRIKNIPTVSRSDLDESRKKRRLTFSVSRKQVNFEHSYRTTIETKSSEEKGFFFLPDLNMTPIEEDETLYGTS